MWLWCACINGLGIESHEFVPLDFLGFRLRDFVNESEETRNHVVRNTSLDRKSVV